MFMIKRAHYIAILYNYKMSIKTFILILKTYIINSIE
jgi:hypothetical protein